MAAYQEDPNGRRIYYIVRMYQDASKAPARRKIKTRLTLAEAQAHCKDPETSWRTCTKSAGKRRTEMYGPWFDGYDCSKEKS